MTERPIVRNMTLSQRGTAASDSDAAENLVWQVVANLWDPTTNPDGIVSLGVAENALMHKELHDFLNSTTLVEETSFTYGDGPSGSKAVRSAIANFFNSYFRPVQDVKSQELVVTNGASSLIEHTAWALCNPGEGILVGRPFYRAFVPDISLRFGAKLVPVAFGDVDPFGELSVAKYEEALRESERNGVKIRALLLSHPHNPLGRSYPRSTISGLMKLCQEHKIHLISDEIYALSTWKNTIDTSTHPLADFESVLSIDTTKLIDPSLVHIIWGLSKDFGANGLRLGVVVSQSNPRYLSAIRTCAIYSSPSSLVENVAVKILTDKSFVKTYIATNQQRLSNSYAHAIDLLRRHDIEYRPGATAAFFIWVDLGKVFRKKHPEITEKIDPSDITATIFKRLMEKNVYLVSGDAAGSEEPGWFRVVFSQPQSLVEEGISRIAQALS